MPVSGVEMLGSEVSEGHGEEDQAREPSLQSVSALQTTASRKAETGSICQEPRTC